MRKRFYYVLLVVSCTTLAFAGYIAFKSRFQQNLSKLIPNDAIAIAHFESTKLFTDSVLNTNSLASVLLADKIPPLLNDSVLQQAPLTLSVHITSATDFQLIFYVQKVENLSDSITIEKSLAVKRFLYETPFYDFSAYSYLNEKHYHVSSISSVLIEDVIRKRYEGVRPFYQRKSFPQKAVGNRQHSVFINFETLPRFLSLFFKEKWLRTQFVRQIPKLGIWSGNYLGNRWEGTWTKQGKASQKQAADTLKVLQWLPHNPVMFSKKNFKKGKNLLKYTQHKDAPKPNKDEKEFYNLLKGEVVWASFSTPSSPVSMVGFSIKNKTNLLAWLAEYALDEEKLYTSLPLRLAEQKLQAISLPFEIMAGIKDRQKLWYTIVDDYLFFFPDVMAFEWYIRKIESKETLANDMQFHRFLVAQNKRMPTDFNYFSVKRLYNYAHASLHPVWQKRFSLQKEKLWQQNFWAMVSSSKPTPQLSFIGQHLKSPKKVTTQNIANIPFRFTLNHGPVKVRNHTDWSWEFLLRDGGNYLSLASEKAGKIWSVPTRSKVKTNIWQIDRFANGKLQYLFGRNHQIYLLDRKGRVVRNFPLSLPFQKKVRHLSVIDYNGKKNYRIFASDGSGDLYKFSKYGTLLKYWNPKRFQQPLATEVKHTRLGEKDFYIVLLENGTLYALNSRGKAYPSFPLSFRESLGEEFYIEKGSNAYQTTISFVTPRGEIIAVNLIGQVVNRSQLPRANIKNAFAMLLSEGSQNDWIVSCKMKEQVQVLRRNGEVIVSSAIARWETPKVQYFNFGRNLRFIAITTVKQGGTALYDFEGNQMAWFEKSRFPVAVTLSKEETLKVHYTIHNKLWISEVTLP